MYEAEIARGMAWLDTHRPGWEQDVNLHQLNMDSPCQCILGQLWGSYYKFMAGACEITPEQFENEDEIVYGFALEDGAKTPDYRELTKEWGLAIERRRAR